MFELPLSVFGCLVSRWRGASSYPTPAYAWHPRRRQLSRDPRDEATSGGSHEEAGISGTGHTFTFQPAVNRQNTEKESGLNICLKVSKHYSWLVCFWLSPPLIECFYKCKLSIFQPFASQISVLEVIVIWNLLLLFDCRILRQCKCTSSNHSCVFLPPGTSISPDFYFHSKISCQILCQENLHASVLFWILQSVSDYRGGKNSIQSSKWSS